MKFEEALVELRKGKSIKRKCHINYLSLKSPINTRVLLIDILNDLNDWEVLEEPGKTFPEVFEAFKEGKNIRRKSWVIGSFICEKKYSEIGWNYGSGMIPSDLLATDWEIYE